MIGLAGSRSFLHTHTHTHTHGCLCKIIIPIIAGLAIVSPTYANIDKDATTATCDSGTIGTTTGPANLQAQWTPNTINIDWYDDPSSLTPYNIQQNAHNCTYDGAITLPAKNPSKPGYTFAGWRVRQLFDLTTLDASKTASYGLAKSLSGDKCAEIYIDNTVNTRDCSDPEYTDLNFGEWRATLDNGTIKGTSICSITKGSWWTAGNPDETGTGYNSQCWCKIIAFADTDSDRYNFVRNPLWIWSSSSGYFNKEDCADKCAVACAGNMFTKRIVNDRKSLYGQQLN